jgi:50S ribosomal protein L16 3-hydroxylase
MTTGLRLLGGLSIDAFLRRHWQRRPLLVRDTGEPAFVSHRDLFALATRDDVESRLVVRDGRTWSLTHGPIAPRMRPPLSQANWTMLVQGVDLHVDAAHRLMQRFAFLSWARLDDVMVSFATDGGGVGAHVDAYDVFLLQLEGHRRWRIEPPRTQARAAARGRASAASVRPGAAARPVADARWLEGVPLKVLRTFEPTDEWLLGPGDMLYIPPGWGHEGVGVGPRCITASVGFRAPQADEVVRDLLVRIADAAGDEADHVADDGASGSPRYRDPGRGSRAGGAGSGAGSGAGAGRIAPSLRAFAGRHLRRALDDRGIALALGEWLTEPKPRVWFEAPEQPATGRWRRRGIALDRRSRMLYDDRAVYLNGESYFVSGADARLLRRLADHRILDAASCREFGRAAPTVDEWVTAGWVIPAP